MAGCAGDHAQQPWVLAWPRPASIVAVAAGALESEQRHLKALNQAKRVHHELKWQIAQSNLMLRYQQPALPVPNAGTARLPVTVSRMIRS